MDDLRERLLAEPARSALIDACERLVLEHVASRRGLKGTALRTGLALLQSVRPDAVRVGVARLLPDFVSAMQPHWARFRAEGGDDFTAWVQVHRERIAADLIAVADERVAATGHAGVQAAYRALRRFAHDEVAVAVPAVGTLIAQHA